MRPRVKNNSSKVMKIMVVTREEIELEPGEEIEVEGDIEFLGYNERAHL